MNIAALCLILMTANPPAEIAINDPNISQTTRYVFVPTKDVYDHICIDWVSNMVMSTATTQIPTIPIGDGTVVRIDLASLAKNEKELQHLIDTWERLAEDEPYFTRSMLIDCPPYKAADGKTYTKKYRRVFPGPLGEKCGTSVPIVEYRYFFKKLLTTTEGGLYYDFRNIPRTQKEFLEKFAGVSEEEVSKLRSDQKYATFFSNVTSKPRAVLVFRGLGGRTAINQGLVMITQDISDDDNDPKKHPIRNLIDNKFTATEIILEQPTGFHTFALFDGNGNRQNAAPDNVVKDHEIPEPYTAKLQGAISCIRCHAKNEGIQPVVNDVPSLMNGKKYKYFGEAFKRIDLDRAFALYSATLDKPFTRARDDYSDALVFLGSRYPIKERLTVTKASAALSQRYADYRYTRVTPEIALSEISAIRAIEQDIFEKRSAKELLNELIPDLPADETGFIPEDPIIVALKTGLKINRSEFEQVFIDIIGRMK